MNNQELKSFDLSRIFAAMKKLKSKELEHFQSEEVEFKILLDGSGGFYEDENPCSIDVEDLTWESLKGLEEILTYIENFNMSDWKEQNLIDPNEEWDDE